ncbi:TetR/AcrR family transcriptional regulator [Nocardia mangyaensis]|uniref:TetR/AcrR family transcriptional regulator n=1 Tax=Nocardia mangyaensis TaxID=2213200 RepID=UPI0026764A82|nr:TetR/AcrR family transcriptional regulator [Nocardia mangyaensis]MDO3646100.1 TetR/AcrR family transcriptional regulator [Nocardia mangyaensis]
MTTEPARPTPPRRSKKAEAQQRGSRSGAQQSGRSRGPRLSYDDWVDGALTLLAREGAAAVRIPRLCEALGVTKGSFYWHFDDIGRLEEAMADRWSTTQAQVIAELATVDSMPIEQRIEAMAAMLVDRNWLVEATVREWSRTRPQVHNAVQELDRKIFDTIRAALAELGFDAETARLRAGAMVYLGIGFIHGRASLPIPTHEEVNTVITLLTRPAP